MKKEQDKENKNDNQSNPVGPPFKYKTKEELEKAVNEYFEDCEKNPIKIYHSQLNKNTGKPVVIKVARPYTVEGLALWLDVTRRTLLNYQKEEKYPELFHTITRAKQRIIKQKIEYSEIGAFNPIITKFDLINNSDYIDKKVFDENQNQIISFREDKEETDDKDK